MKISEVMDFTFSQLIFNFVENPLGFKIVILPTISFSACFIAKFVIFFAETKTKLLMARPIQDTPILRGDDARRFVELMNTSRPETSERKAQIKAANDTVMKMLSRNFHT